MIQSKSPVTDRGGNFEAHIADGWLVEGAFGYECLDVDS